MDNKCDCPQNGYLHVDSYDSRLIESHFSNNPEDKKEVDEFLDERNITKNSILLALCIECQGLRIRMKSRMDKIFDTYKDKGVY
ncbi:MAG: hypothetical protein ACK4NC_06785 [Candidatus Gracilibacteria bacterium]